jgi:flagellar basal-body rod protein FlgF
MLYGLYLSAGGVMSSSYKQDVIANNLANSETTGFKRDIPAFRQRLTQAQESRRPGDWSDPVLEGLGGGLFVQPSQFDLQQGAIEKTGNPLDVAIEGNGFFAVSDKGQTRLTRDGRFRLDQHGNLINNSGQSVVDDRGAAISIPTDGPVSIDAKGAILERGKVVGQIGTFDVPDYSKLEKLGDGLLAYSDANRILPTSTTVHGESLESSNVDPATELTELMDSQRQLEMNANMIHIQDTMLQRLVNDVGKIS